MVVQCDMVSSVDPTLFGSSIDLSEHRALPQ